MAVRRASLQPRPQLPPQQPAVAPRTRRYAPVALAWIDTGTLCSLALRPAWLNRVIDLYAGSLVVTEAVASEVRRFVNGLGQRSVTENHLLRLGATTAAQKLDNQEIRVLPLSPTEEAIIELDRILRQLKEFEVAQNAKFHRPSDEVASALKHTGEAHSIVNALRTRAHGRETILLTNDGGAIAIARQNGIAWKHVGQLLVELACEDSQLNADRMYQDYLSITATFASVPTTHRPADASDFVCAKGLDGSCTECT